MSASAANRWPGWMLLSILLLAWQGYQSVQARVQRADIMREQAEIKALVWLAAEQCGTK